MRAVHGKARHNGLVLAGLRASATAGASRWLPFVHANNAMTTALPPLPVTLLRHLNLAPGAHPQGRVHVSAASGLVRCGQRLFVVGDDELHLGVFEDGAPATPPQPGHLLRLLDGKLPTAPAQRKAAKPDLETLALLPPSPGSPGGALLALGSGSTPQRCRGVLLALDAQGQPQGPATVRDLTALYAPLRQRFAELNLEGALVVDGALLLLHRGNQGQPDSACIRYDGPHALAWLAGQRSDAPTPLRVQTLALGTVDGVALTLTDGTPLHGGAWAFCAVAEASTNSYDDGRCVASAVGIVAADGQVQSLRLLQGAPKVEGIAAQARGAGWCLTLVTDPDHPATAAQLLQVHLAA